MAEDLSTSVIYMSSTDYTSPYCNIHIVYSLKRLLTLIRRKLVKGKITPTMTTSSLLLSQEQLPSWEQFFQFNTLILVESLWKLTTYAVHGMTFIYEDVCMYILYVQLPHKNDTDYMITGRRIIPELTVSLKLL